MTEYLNRAGVISELVRGRPLGSRTNHIAERFAQHVAILYQPLMWPAPRDSWSVAGRLWRAAGGRVPDAGGGGVLGRRLRLPRLPRAVRQPRQPRGARLDLPAVRSPRQQLTRRQRVEIHTDFAELWGSVLNGSRPITPATPQHLSPQHLPHQNRSRTR